MPSHASTLAAHHRSWGSILVALVIVLVGLTACEQEPLATVVRVIDGDTIDVEYEGEQRRVRLLNIDTPESVHPKVEPECLGVEAADFLRDLLPLGTEVRLVFDQQLQDRYDRYLAGVYLDRELINAEIARAGLGIAMLIKPNQRFYGAVAEAQDEARAAGRGLYDPTLECTLPAQLHNFDQASDQVLQSAPAHGGDCCTDR